MTLRKLFLIERIFGMNEQVEVKKQNTDVIPQELAIQAMRDSGYRNTAYAIAELVDNAVQAGAHSIEIFCIEDMVKIEKRRRRRLQEIAVLDDGEGMDAGVLCRALQFGNGSRLEDRTGIGRFGMGLPNSSISQASRVDVWTWQNGVENALHSYLDVEEISSGQIREVPRPKYKRVPKNWQDRAVTTKKTGTLVVWTRLSMERMTWKSAQSTLQNTGWLIGRIHRKFLEKNSLTIRLVSIIGEQSDKSLVAINDPMYLIPSPNLPEPFRTEPMFEYFLDEFVDVELNGNVYPVKTRYSIARPETVSHASNGERGQTQYGRDAQKNMGVSVLRAGRELMLDRSWTIHYDPRERWWGCEVDFPPALDEIFGVTNNKQAATQFSELSELDWKELCEDGETTMEEVQARLTEEGDPHGVLLCLSDKIKSNLGLLRKKIKAQAKGTRGGGKERHRGENPTDKANKRWKERDEKKPLPDGDSPPSDNDLEMIKEDLAEDGRTIEESNNIVARVESGELKIIFVDKELGSSGDLFVVRPRGGVTEVVFNRIHPAFDRIFDTVSMDENLEALSTDDLQRRLYAASSAVHTLFAAWARMEREDTSNHRNFERVREAWGKLARDFLEDPEEHNQQ